MITLKTAIQALREIKHAEWSEILAVYEKYPELKQAEGCSPFYNRFTAQKQTWDIQNMQVGDKNTLYFDDSTAREYAREHETRMERLTYYPHMFKVTTWTGKQIGHVTNVSFFHGSGFAPAKRVSVTFQYRGMVFRGICSYENMQCFTIKRVK